MTSTPPADSWERVGSTIRNYRQMRGYKPDEFADKIGFSRPYLANIEAGRKPLTPVLLARVAAVLRVPQHSIMAAADSDAA